MNYHFLMPSTQQTIEVERTEIKKARYPDILMSSAMYITTSIGFYDPRTQSAYMLQDYYQLGSPELKRLDERIDVIIRQDYQKLSGLTVIVAGNSWPKDYYGELSFLSSNRRSIESILRRYFAGNQITYLWAPPINMSRLFLDTSTGKHKIRFSSLL